MIMEYSFLFPLVQELYKSTKKWELQWKMSGSFFMKHGVVRNFSISEKFVFSQYIDVRHQQQVESSADVGQYTAQREVDRRQSLTNELS